MRRILFSGVFALVIGTLLAGDARGQLQVYNMQCLRVNTFGGDLAPWTLPQNYWRPDGASASPFGSLLASTPGTGLLVSGTPWQWNQAFAQSGGSVTAADGTWFASSTSTTRANCEVPIGANIFVPIASSQVTVNLSAGGPAFAVMTTNAWSDEATCYTGYSLLDPSTTDASKGTLLGTLYFVSQGAPADGNVNGGVDLIAGIHQSEVRAAAGGPAGWWISGSYRQDYAGNRSGSVPDVVQPPVVLNNAVPPTFSLMLFPTEIVIEGPFATGNGGDPEGGQFGSDGVLIYSGALDNSQGSAPIGPASGGGVNYQVDFQANAWFEIEIDPN